MATNTNTFKTRVQLKSDTETNWNKAGPKNGSPGFIPLLGELIVYTADDAHPFSRLKVGDGETNVVDLPFIDAGTICGEDLSSQISVHSSYSAFPSPGTPNKLYIDLQTNTIYCYTDLSGYTQLSNWKYTASKTSVSRITDWSIGVPTTLEENGGILKVTTGIQPSLTYYNTNVVSNITRSDE